MEGFVLCRAGRPWCSDEESRLRLTDHHESRYSRPRDRIGIWRRGSTPDSGGKALNPNADLGPPLVGRDGLCRGHVGLAESSWQEHELTVFCSPFASNP